ncbi:MAG TPA: acyl-CoA dehydrogenase family protein [Candidatus Acidoferrum sp.]|nr:acyl-CoA dehydrogenase family protein [Candidatus Acidoferrum sp.]
MDVLPNEEQAMIAEQASAFLQSAMPVSGHLNRMSHTPVDRGLWSKAAALGWFGLGVAQDEGGVGFGLPEEALLFREIGRYLAPTTLLLATTLAAHLSADVKGAELATILNGQTVVALAEPDDPDMTIGTRLSGQIRVLDSIDSNLVLICGNDAAAVVETAALGHVTEIPCIDGSTQLGYSSLDDVAAMAHASGPNYKQRGMILSTASLCGIAEATRDASANYAKLRHQFGRPIGSFQAVKHRCADMAVRCEAATAQLFYAALVASDGAPDREFQTVAARLVAVDAAVRNGEDNIQNHGGIGFTAEHSAHAYLKRARLLQHLFGDRHSDLSGLLALPAPIARSTVGNSTSLGASKQ